MKNVFSVRPTGKFPLWNCSEGSPVLPVGTSRLVSRVRISSPRDPGPRKSNFLHRLLSVTSNLSTGQIRIGHKPNKCQHLALDRYRWSSKAVSPWNYSCCCHFSAQSIQSTECTSCHLEVRLKLVYGICRHYNIAKHVISVYALWF